VGPKRSRAALEQFLSKEPDWDHIFLVGLAGALDTELKTGEVVAASSVSDGKRTLMLSRQLSFPRKRESRLDPPVKPEDDRRKNVNPGAIKTVPFFTSPRILKPSEKTAVSQQDPNLKAVDMESFGLCEVLLPRKAPFTVLRAILDENDYVFPDFRWIFPKWRLADHFQFILYALGHPDEACRIAAFRKKLKFALRCLAEKLFSIISTP
jgi:nucleoside phosphorylase